MQTFSRRTCTLRRIVYVPLCSFSCRGLTGMPSDPLLGACLKARWLMDSALRQVRIRSDRRTRPSTRVDLTASTMAEWLVLCCNPLDIPLLVHLPLQPYGYAQVLDSRRDGVSSVQFDLLVVRSRTLHYQLSPHTHTDVGFVGQLLHRFQSPDERYGGRFRHRH